MRWGGMLYELWLQLHDGQSSYSNTSSMASSSFSYLSFSTSALTGGVSMAS